MDDELSLLTPIEEYFTSHDKDGMSYVMSKLSKHEQRKRKVGNLYLLNEVEMTYENDIPQVKAYNGPIDFELFSYRDKKRISMTATTAIHFFMDDYSLERAWNKLSSTTHNLMELNCTVFALDFSLYVSAPKIVNMNNIYRSRFATAYWQKCGLRVIPTASWGDVDSFKYCFDGLPEHSVIAVCGIGHDHCRSAVRLFYEALHTLEDKKSPTKIIVYGGKKPDATQFDAEIVYFEDYITKHFR